MSKTKKQLQRYQINTLLRMKNIILLYQHSNIKAQDWVSMKQELSEISSRELTAGYTPALERPPGAKEGMGIKMKVTPHCQAGHLPSIPLRIKEVRGVSMLAIKNRIGYLSLLSFKEGATHIPSLSTCSPGGSKLNSLRPPLVHHEVLREGEEGVEVALHGSPLLSDAAVCKFGRYSQGETSLLQGSMFLLACHSHEEMVSAHQIILRCRDKHKTSAVMLVGGFYFGRVVTHVDVAKLTTLTPLLLSAVPIALEKRIASLVNEELVYCQRQLLHCLDAYKNLLAGS